MGLWFCEAPAKSDRRPLSDPHCFHPQHKCSSVCFGAAWSELLQPCGVLQCGLVQCTLVQCSAVQCRPAQNATKLRAISVAVLKLTYWQSVRHKLRSFLFCVFWCVTRPKLRGSNTLVDCKFGRYGAVGLAAQAIHEKHPPKVAERFVTCGAFPKP